MPHTQPCSSFRNSLPLVIFTCIILGTAMAVSGCCGITGCNLFSTQDLYENSYTVTVTGLSNYTGSDGFRILLPAPMLNGTPAYTGNEIRSGRLIFPPPVSIFADYETVNESRLVNNTGWTASLVDTERGPMIELTPANVSLSDIMYILIVTKDVPVSERDQYPKDAVNQTVGPLYPVASEPAGSYTVPTYYSYGKYSSYLLMDGSLTPLPGAEVGNISVSVDYHELFAEGSVPTFRQSCQINESLPGNVTGWIPVTVQKTE